MHRANNFPLKSNHAEKSGKYADYKICDSLWYRLYSTIACQRKYWIFFNILAPEYNLDLNQYSVYNQEISSHVSNRKNYLTV